MEEVISQEELNEFYRVEGVKKVKVLLSYSKEIKYDVKYERYILDVVVVEVDGKKVILTISAKANYINQMTLQRIINQENIELQWSPDNEITQWKIRDKDSSIWHYCDIKIV